MLKQTGATAIGICAVLGAVGGHTLAAELSARDLTSQLIIQLDDTRLRSIQSVQRDEVLPDIRLPDGRSLTFKRRFHDNAVVVELPEDMTLDAAQQLSEQLAGLPGIAAVQPDKRLYPALVPNDPAFPPGADAINDPGQWYLHEDTAGIRMQPAWDRTTGSSSVVVAVLDTGIIAHRDLSGARVLAGYDFYSDTLLDNDGTPGRDADPTDPGDATVNDECGAGVPGQDSSWHGLSVSGVIVAESDNNLDIAGIDFAARLLPVRVLGKCGGDLSDVADAVRWAAGLAVTGIPANPNPAKVINLSLSGAGACSPQEQAAINDAVGAGAVVVAAAGNEATNVANISPANCNNVVTVGAIARDGSIASYTNFGLNVDLVAPGGDDPVPADPLNPPNGVLTLWNLGTTVAGGDVLAFIQGTSFTAAQVSGVVSLMFAIDSSLSPSTVEGVLRATTRAFPDASCTTAICGTGVLDADAALAGAVDPASVLGGNANSGNGGGGGGCSLSPNDRAYDLFWPLLLLVIGVRFAARRRGS